jgi:hypothetical protein
LFPSQFYDKTLQNRKETTMTEFQKRYQIYLNIFLVVVTLFALIAAIASAVMAGTAKADDLRPCQLGTAWAVNPDRQPADGEHEVSARGGPVLMTQRETPGSSHIVWRRCNLAANEKVVVGGTPWVSKCGNDFLPLGWLLPEPPKQGLQGTTGPRGPEGPQGKPGAAGKDAELPLPPPLLWGISGGGSRDWYSGPLANRDACDIRSWTGQLGIAYGDPYRLFARLSAMAIFIEDGSSSVYYNCPGCRVVVVSQGAKAYGGNVEAVGLLGRRTWPVQVALYAEGGVESFSGKVTRYVTNQYGVAVSSGDPKELYDSQGWHGGGGAGLLWHTSHFTVEVTAKYRYPYGYSVGLMLTKWFNKK